MTVRRLSARLATIVSLVVGAVIVCWVLFHISNTLLARTHNVMVPTVWAPSRDDAEDALRAPEWGRRASCEIDLDGTQSAIVVRTGCDLSISVRDPLFPFIRAGEVSQAELFQGVVGLSIVPVGQPVVIRHRSAERAIVRLDSTDSIPWKKVDYDSHPFKNVANTIEFDLINLENPGYRLLWNSQGAVETRGMSVRLTGFTLVGISGSVPVAQNESSVTIEGPPGDALTLRMATNEDTYNRLQDIGKREAVPTEVFQPLADLLPLLLLVVLGYTSKLWQFRHVRRFSWAVLGIVVGLTTMTALYLATGWLEYYGPFWLSGWTFLCGAPLLVALLVTRADRPPRVFPEFHLYLALPLAATGTLVWLGFAAGRPFTAMLVLGCVVCAAVLGGVAAGLLWGRGSAMVGVTLSVGAAASCFSLEVVSQVESGIRYALGGGYAEGFFLLIAAVFGIGLLPLVNLTLRQFRRNSPSVSPVLVIACALFLISIPKTIGVLSGYVTTSYDLVYAFESWSVYVKLTLLASFVPVLITASKRRIPFSEPALLVCGAAAIVIVLPGFATSDGLYDLLAGIVAAAIFLWVVPKSRAGRAARLSGLSTKVHNRLVRGEVRRRILRQAGTQFLRGSRADPVDWRTLGERFDEIDAVEHRVAREDRTHVSASAAAFGSGGGQTRWENLRHGVALAGLLSVPLIAYEAWVTFEGSYRTFFAYSTLEMLDYLRVALRWLVYGAVFGYFYTLIRGHDPVSKAIRLLVVLGVAETIAVLGSSSETAWQLLLDVSVRLGLMVFFFVGLGLLWERHLARLASVPWNRVRDLRRGRSLVAPMTTVIVAGVTVVVTALTSAAISPIVPAPPVFEQQDPLTTGQQK